MQFVEPAGLYLIRNIDWRMKSRSKKDKKLGSRQERGRKIMKRCNECGLDKELIEFYKTKSSKDGHTARCKDCINLSQKKYREANKVQIAARRKEYDKEYQANNPDKCNAKVAKRRAQKKKATLPDTDFEAIEELFAEAKRLEKLTGQKYHVDHKIPLSKGGPHHQDNLQVIPAEENLRKGAMMPNEFYLQKKLK